MNKGIGLASSNIIGILNTDDFYSSPDILKKVVGAFNDPEIESCYGDLHYVDPVDTHKVIRNWISGECNARKF